MKTTLAGTETSAVARPNGQLRQAEVARGVRGHDILNLHFHGVARNNAS